jgi:hypothetical protein
MIFKRKIDNFIGNIFFRSADTVLFLTFVPAFCYIFPLRYKDAASIRAKPEGISKPWQIYKNKKRASGL